MTHSVNELPFPWSCGKCGHRSVERVTIPYSTEVQYDGRGYTVEVPEFQVPRCKNCGAMVLDDRANDQIIDSLRRQVGLLAPEQIRNNRESLRLKQRDFANLLGVGESTVSRWENGAQIQQKSLDRLMRLFFAIPEVRAALADGDRLAALGIQIIEKSELTPEQRGTPAVAGRLLGFLRCSPDAGILTGEELPAEMTKVVQGCFYEAPSERSEGGPIRVALVVLDQ